MISEDGKTDPATGLDRVKKLVEIDGVQIIAGPMITGSSKLAIPYLMEHNVPGITMSATNPLLDGVEGTEWFQLPALLEGLPHDVEKASEQFHAFSLPSL